MHPVVGAQRGAVNSHRLRDGLVARYSQIVGYSGGHLGSNPCHDSDTTIEAMQSSGVGHRFICSDAVRNVRTIAAIPDCASRCRNTMSVPRIPVSRLASFAARCVGSDYCDCAALGALSCRRAASYFAVFLQSPLRSAQPPRIQKGSGRTYDRKPFRTEIA